jgi:hypothetical protein
MRGALQQVPRQRRLAARGTSLISSQAQKKPQKTLSTTLRSFSSPAQAPASASSNRASPSSVRPTMM